ncbi:MAG TPA: MarR family winged helix-turn-helix transcriptional regulator [Thermoleophilaceae bacterium]|jgi:DNA-binding MarR family transcriptional regulator
MSERIALPTLLAQAKEAAIAELHARMAGEGFTDIRSSHGCVFAFIDPEGGSRLTYLADRSGLTKQAVGEAVDDLEERGYVRRAPDPLDKRAKIIKLTERGDAALATSKRIFDEIERDWQEQLGEDIVVALRSALERLRRVGAEEPGATPARLRG